MSHGHSHKRSTGVRIMPQDLDTLRYDSDGNQVIKAWDRIGKASEDYVRIWHGSGLLEEDIKDISYDARADWYPLAMTVELPFDLVQDELSRALDRHKKRVQRLPVHLEFDSNIYHIDPEEKIRVMRLMHEIIDVLSPHMEIALKRLKSRYHDLVVLEQGLEDFFDLKEPKSREKHAKEIANNGRVLYRALERFRVLLEESLVLALEGAGSKRLAIELALKIVRADMIEELLGFADGA